MLLGACGGGGAAGARNRCDGFPPVDAARTLRALRKAGSHGRPASRGAAVHPGVGREPACANPSRVGPMSNSPRRWRSRAMSTRLGHTAGPDRG